MKKVSLLLASLLALIGSTVILSAQTRVRDLDTGGSSSPSSFVEWRGSTYFVAYDSSAGTSTSYRQLWRSDGSPNGTIPLRPNGQATNQRWRVLENLTPTTHHLFFTVTTEASGTELWATDGTRAGTSEVKDIGPGKNSGVVHGLCVVDETLYFVAATPELTPLGFRYEHNLELWQSDGTAAGTSLVVDLTPAWGAPSSQVAQLTAYQGLLYFVAKTTGTGLQLWQSDGTAVGTRVVFPSAPTGQMLVFGDKLHFLANKALWLSDGTTAGTKQVAAGPFFDMHPTSSQIFMTWGKELHVWDGLQARHLATIQNMQWLTSLDDRLFFRGYDGATGAELWVSDGTLPGTKMVIDLAPGRENGLLSPSRARGTHFLEAAGSDKQVVFTGRSGTTMQVFVSDGTASGTRQLSSFVRPWIQMGPADYHRHGTQIFFSNYDSSGDIELWSMPVGKTGSYVLEHFGLGCAGTGASAPRIETTGTPNLGNANFAFQLSGALPFTPAAVLIGSERSSMAWDGCEIAVSPLIPGPWFITNASGAASLPVPMPVTTSLIGNAAAFQWVAIDPQGAFLGTASLSRGLLVVVGQ